MFAILPEVLHDAQWAHFCPECTLRMQHSALSTVGTHAECKCQLLALPTPSCMMSPTITSVCFTAALPSCSPVVTLLSGQAMHLTASRSRQCRLRSSFDCILCAHRKSSRDRVSSEAYSEPRHAAAAPQYTWLARLQQSMDGRR